MTAGLSVSVAGDQLRIRGPQGAADIGRELMARKLDVIAHLSQNLWDQAEALRLMDSADWAVEVSGVPGTHPKLQPAIASWSAAYAARDISGCRRAALAVVVAARVLAGFVARREATR